MIKIKKIISLVIISFLLITEINAAIKDSLFATVGNKAITRSDIINEIKIGNFREDLFHRLNVFNINIDPLNKRTEDIPLLVEYFLRFICKNYNI